jgi:hypothetical protein
MKKYFLFLVLAIVVPSGIMAQNWLNRIANDYRQRSQQRTTQRNYNQRSYQNSRRNDRQVEAYQQGRESQQRNNYQQQNFNTERVSSSNNVSSSNINNQLQGNDKVVTLVTSGSGSTKEEATRNALRNAIEQTFGTFVSSNTEVLNDELIKDEIISVTSGNIEKYSLISSDNTIEGKTTVIVKAIVSIGKLVQYAQSKGTSVELAGATFAMNMKIRKMETNNEYQALLMLRKQMCQIAKKGIYDYNVTTEEPSLKNYYCRYPGNMSDSQIKQYNNSYKVEIRIDYIPNNNAKALIECIIRTLKGIAIPLSEVESYKKAGLPVYKVSDDIYLRNNPFTADSKRLMPFELLMLIKTLAACSFNLTDNLGNNIFPVMDNEQQDSYTIAKELNHTFSVRDKHIPELIGGHAFGIFRNNYNTDSRQYWYQSLYLETANFHILFLLHYTENELSNLSTINVSYNRSLMESFINKYENDGFRLSN